MTPAIFLDRDGVIIEDRSDFVKSWDEVKFVPSAFDAIRRLTEAGLPIVIVTNQSAIGRGIVTSEFVKLVHTRMVSEIEQRGGHITGVYFCPHLPDAGCDCRKPEPGMLFQAAKDLDLDLSASIIVGDSLRDIAAGFSAGMPGILVRTGKGAQEEILLRSGDGSVAQPFAIVDDIAAAADLILERKMVSA